MLLTTWAEMVEPKDLSCKGGLGVASEPKLGNGPFLAHCFSIPSGRPFHPLVLAKKNRHARSRLVLWRLLRSSQMLVL